MRNLLGLFLLILPLISFCQTPAGKVPFYKTYSVKSLSKALVKNEETEYQKAEAIYLWITTHIRYDLKAFLKYREKELSAAQVLRRRKGICSHFAQLYSELCKHAGVKAFDIPGYSKGFGFKHGQTFFWEDHAWNAVKTDSTWIFMDLTWGSGHIEMRKQAIRQFLFRKIGLPFYGASYKFVRQPNKKWFNVKPAEFIQTHLAADPKWQLLHTPVPVEAFSYSPDSATNYLIAHKDTVLLDYPAEIRSEEHEKGIYRVYLSAKDAYSFYPENDKIIAYASMKLGKDLLRKGEKNRITDTTAHIEYLEKPIRLFQDAIKHAKNFKADNAKLHKIKLDSINSRHKVINSWNGKELSRTNIALTKSKRAIRSYKYKIYLTRRSIKNFRFRHIRQTSDNISRIRRPDKEPDMDNISLLKQEIFRNHKAIDSVQQELNFYRDTISGIRRQISSSRHKILDLQHEIVQFTEFNTAQNSALQPLGSIEKIHMVVSSLSDSIHQYILLISDLVSDQSELNRRKDLQHRIIQSLHRQNKRILSSIKRTSGFNLGEDTLYITENRKLSYALEASLQKLHSRTAEMQDLITWNEKLVEVYKKKLKALKSEKRLEDLHFTKTLRSENSRYRLYNYRSAKIIATSTKGIASAKRLQRKLQ